MINLFNQTKLDSFKTKTARQCMIQAGEMIGVCSCVLSPMKCLAFPIEHQSDSLLQTKVRAFIWCNIYI